MYRLAAAFLITFLFAGQALSASRLLNYENRVVEAAEQIKRIKADRDYKDEGVSFIKSRLPRLEKIDFDGQEVTVDNTWLHVLLDSYAAEKDPQQQRAKLNEVEGRLRALDSHLRRAERDDSNIIDNAPEKIREILSRPSYQPEPETPLGAFLKKLMRKVREFIGEIYSAITRLLEKLVGTSGSGGWLPKVLLFVVLASALFMVVRLARRIRRPQPKRKKTRLVLGEEVAADSTSRELAEAGLIAARAGDFRTAVRKLYVSLLYELSEHNLIELEDSATNHEYLARASKLSGLAGPMGYMTDRFDYVWYGMFPSSADDFDAYFSRYSEAMEAARSWGLASGG